MADSSAFEKLFQHSGIPAMTAAERKRATILIVEPDQAIKKNLKDALTRLGYGFVSETGDHASALKKYEERPFTHVVFEAKKTNMPTMDFLVKILELDDRIIAVPSSWDPTLDDVFDMLIIGARGYLVKPFTEASVDDSIVMASKGEPLSDAILYAKNRNEALASLCLTAVDKMAMTLRQSQKFETAAREIPKRSMGLKRSVDIAKTFSQGGHEGLLESVIELCVERANGPASSLGRLRKRLEAKKAEMLDKIRPKASSTPAENGSSPGPAEADLPDEPDKTTEDPE